MKKWWNNLIKQRLELLKEYSDSFRIRKIILFGGEIKYYSEYRNNTLGLWLQLVELKDGSIIPIQLTNYELIYNIYCSVDSSDYAEVIIECYKKQLAEERRLDFFDEEFITVK